VTGEEEIEQRRKQTCRYRHQCATNVANWYDFLLSPVPSIVTVVILILILIVIIIIIVVVVVVIIIGRALCVTPKRRAPAIPPGFWQWAREEPKRLCNLGDFVDGDIIFSS
jgi:hypothetical protein